MSAREAYIAGRYGGSKPKDTSSQVDKDQGFGNREQDAYDAGQQERQREQILQSDQGIAGLSQREQDQAKTIAKKTGKDPYDKLTREEERKAGYPETFSETLKDAYNEYVNFGGFAGLAMVPFRMISEPTVKTFQNPQALAVLKLLFDRKGQEFKDKYLKDHGDIIGDAFKDERELLKESGQGITTLDFFDQELDEAVRMSEEGVLGAGSQRINFPEEFYTGENSARSYGSGVMPQTSGDLANLAGLDVNQFTSGPGYNQKMVDMIFAARMELDRMGKNPMTGESQGQGGQGITSIPSSNFIGFTPDNMNAAKYPKGYGAFLLNPPAPVRPGSPTIQGFPDQDGDGVDDRYQAGPGIPRPGIESVGLGIGSPKIPGDKMNIPAAFNYASMAPQFTGSPYTNQGVSPAFLENLRRFYG